MGESKHREQSAGVYCHNVGVRHRERDGDRKPSASVHMRSDQYLDCLEDFLASPLPKSLFATHPNDAVKPCFVPPPEWGTWWDWAASAPEPSVALLNYYVAVRNLDSCSRTKIYSSLRWGRGPAVIYRARSYR